MKNIHLVAAARPNFMKIAPLYHAIKKEAGLKPIIVHTGQHYDCNMSDYFIRDLNLPDPHVYLGIGSGTHAEQVGKVMIAYERILMNDRPDCIVVVGDVNSTMAATLASVKLKIKVAHLEAGLRSFDRTMPEEINRVVTDSLADLLWTPSTDADENLLREGIANDKIVRVGNIMIDSLEMLRLAIECDYSYKKYNVKKRAFCVVTLHRPSNVEDPQTLEKICNILKLISEEIKIIFPIHPRTKEKLNKYGLYDDLEQCDGIHLTNPLNYISFMNLVFKCALVITDSGGIQEETTYLGIPCITLRENTERPITVTHGTNKLCTPDNLIDCFMQFKTQRDIITRVPDLWDGHTADRVIVSLKQFLM
jgi:UDP-N-acetylglucosamine 2-epimerase (non-hydrolysing)